MPLLTSEHLITPASLTVAPDTVAFTEAEVAPPLPAIAVTLNELLERTSKEPVKEIVDAALIVVGNAQYPRNEVVLIKPPLAKA